MKMNLPWVESPFFEKILQEKKLPSEQEAMARVYNKDGYIVLKNVFSEDEINKVVSEMHEKGFNPDYNLIKTRDANRCQDLWENSEAVKNLSIKPEILSTLEMLYSREVYPFRR